MANEPSVAVGGTETEYRCECGWRGLESELKDWDVQRYRDRIVRVCPGCCESVPEWGCLKPIDAAARLARGSMRESLAAQGVDVE